MFRFHKVWSGLAQGEPGVVGEFGGAVALLVVNYVYLTRIEWCRVGWVILVRRPSQGGAVVCI